jgi:hypothetical protein
MQRHGIKISPSFRLFCEMKLQQRNQNIRRRHHHHHFESDRMQKK